MSYTFSTLNAIDFESLVRDLIGFELGIRFEGFRPGPDGGIDGRHCTGGNRTILQAKHYRGSLFRDLKSAMKKEREAIDSINPVRYILATSLGLNPRNKAELKRIIGPSLNDESDIFGFEDLNYLLLKHQDVLEFHIKLWMSETKVLQKIVKSGVYVHDHMRKSGVERNLRLYVENKSLHDALKILDEHSILIISGPAGIGKSTLSNIISLRYRGQSWNVIFVRKFEDLVDIFSEKRRALYIFDDFLGRYKLNDPAALKQDSALSELVRHIANSKKSRLLLITRTYILEEARKKAAESEDDGADIYNYVLSVEQYTRKIRAMILYNHLSMTGAEYSLVRSLIESKRLSTIIDHPMYNPRVIARMTSGVRLAKIGSNPDHYADAFLKELDNPKFIWTELFNDTLDQKARVFLFALYFCEEHGAKVDEIDRAYGALYKSLLGQLSGIVNPSDLVSPIPHLEGDFIENNNYNISFINPSVQDFLTERVNLYIDSLAKMVAFGNASQKLNWAKRVWDHGKEKGFEVGDLAQFANSFTKIARKSRSLPAWEPHPTDPQKVIITDLGNEERILLLVDWWAASRNPIFAEQAILHAASPIQDYKAWLDVNKLIGLIVKTKDKKYIEQFPRRKEFVAHLELRLKSIIEGTIPAGHVASFNLKIKNSWGYMTRASRRAWKNLAKHELKNVKDRISNIYSEVALNNHVLFLEGLKKEYLAPDHEIDNALAAVRMRIEKLRAAPKPDDIGVLQAAEPDQDITDREIVELFSRLMSTEALEANQMADESTQ